MSRLRDEFTCRKTICAVVLWGGGYLPLLKRCMDAVDNQIAKPHKKIVAFCGRNPPEFFKDYPEWDYTLCANVSTGTDIVCILDAQQIIAPDYFYNIYSANRE